MTASAVPTVAHAHPSCALAPARARSSGARTLRGPATPPPARGHGSVRAPVRILVGALKPSLAQPLRRRAPPGAGAHTAVQRASASASASAAVAAAAPSGSGGVGPACSAAGDEGRRRALWRGVLSAAVAVVAATAWYAVAAGPATAAASAAASAEPLSIANTLLNYILHLDKHMHGLIAKYGMWIYGVLFSIVFAETGLVVTPFLPGDSLLFACGTLSALGSLNIWLCLATLFTAAVLGDTVNYAVGKWLGAKVFTDTSPIFKKSYLKKTQGFYDQYGGKTVVLARFIPIVRTFAPFVAGVGSMDYSKFFYYNVLGAAVWNAIFVGVGYFFGRLPFVQENFSVSVLAIIAISVLPILYEVWEARKEKKPAAPKPSAEGA